MFSIIFLKDAAERCAKTVAQSILSILTLEGMDVFRLNWGQTMKLALTAGAISFLTSIVSAGVRERGTASLVVNPPSPPPNNSVKG